MFRAYCAKFVLNIRFGIQSVDRLRTTQALRDLCGFGDAVPSASTISLFTSRLADYADLTEKATTRVTNQLRDLIAQVCQPKSKLRTKPEPASAETYAVAQSP